MPGIQLKELVLDHILPGLFFQLFQLGAQRFKPRLVGLVTPGLFCQQQLGRLFDLVQQRRLGSVIFGAQGLGPFEQHMFQQVGNTPLIAAFMGTAHFKADPGRNRG